MSKWQTLAREALNTLSIEQREVIELAYFSGLSQDEIALKLGRPLATIKACAYLGMMKLREALNPMPNV